ncbi:MAG: tetratricopeptide repeat protein [Myxococcales bacterium]|nr:tetratricopeptide repeat protein [Myxococcales bacterium]
MDPRDDDSPDDAAALATLCARAEQLSSALRGPEDEQLAALAELAALHPVVIDQLTRRPTASTRDASLRLIAALARFWWIRGLGPEVLPIVEAALRAVPADIDARSLTAARQGAGELYYARADYTAARRAFERAATATARGDARAEADAINGLRMVDREQGRHGDARARHARAIELYQQAGDERGRAHATGNLGVVAFRSGQLDEAAELHGRALALRREHGDLHGVASSLGNLALIHRARRAPARARPLYLEGLRAREQLGDTWGVAGSRVCLCAIETEPARSRRPASTCAPPPAASSRSATCSGSPSPLRPGSRCTCASPPPATGRRSSRPAPCSRSPRPRAPVSTRRPQIARSTRRAPASSAPRSARRGCRRCETGPRAPASTTRARACARCSTRELSILEILSRAGDRRRLPKRRRATAQAW